jgi:hypothetical protein
VNNLALTPSRVVQSCALLIFPIGSRGEKAVLTKFETLIMSAKRQTFYVEKTERGWVVRTDAKEDHLGPYSDRERAMTMALIFARDNQPSQVKVQTATDHWRVEYTFDERGRAPV